MIDSLNGQRIRTVGLALMCIGLIAGSCSPSPPPVTSDELPLYCIITINVLVWADTNADGIYNPDESPLSEIAVNLHAVSDPEHHVSINTEYDGRATLEGSFDLESAYLDKCELGRFEAEVTVPEGFIPTLPDLINLKDYGTIDDVVMFGLQPPDGFIVPTLASDALSCERFRDGQGFFRLDVAPSGELVGTESGRLFYGDRVLEHWNEDETVEVIYLTQSGAVWVVPYIPYSLREVGYTRDATSWQTFDEYWMAYLSPALFSNESGMIWFASTYRGDTVVLGYDPNTGEIISHVSHWGNVEGPDKLIVARYQDEWFAAVTDDPDFDLPVDAPEGWELVDVRILDDTGHLPAHIDNFGTSAIEAGTDGMLWIAAEHVLYQYDSNHNEWRNVSPEPSDVQGEFSEVEELSVTPNGTVWIISGQHRHFLMRYQNETWQLLRGGYDDTYSFLELAASDDTLYLGEAHSISRCEVLAD